MSENKLNVFVVDNNEDNVTTEGTAMLQALYSRSTKSAKDHVERIQKDGSGEFMRSFYVGYGHESIAQTGSTTIFAEGISMLAAKAIQDSSLYNGQETSSRYVDMLSTGVHIPKMFEDDQRVKDIAGAWMNLYVQVNDIMLSHYKELYGYDEKTSDKKLFNTIKAKAFDVARGWLVAGTKTQASWHTTLNNFDRNRARLMNHMCKEIQDIGNAMSEAMVAKYPDTIVPMTAEKLEWTKTCIESIGSYVNFYQSDNEFTSTIELTPMEFRLLTKRPKYAPIPSQFKHFGQLQFITKLDFGSYRDIQRHRGLNINMPMLCFAGGFNYWYINQLPEEYRGDIVKRMESLVAMTNDVYNEYTKDRPADQYVDSSVDTVRAELQYITPLLTNVTVCMEGPLDAMVYTTELRTNPSVHQSLRLVMQKLAKEIYGVLSAEGERMNFKEKAGYYPNLTSEPELNLKRGEQTITEKK